MALGPCQGAYFPYVITAINRHWRLWANGELPVFSGQPATALQQLKLPMRQKRNGLGFCAAMGPCNPQLHTPTAH